MKPIVVVSGVPRSGTSMMMQALVAGGLEAVTDRQREADSNNVKGYLEHEAVKRLAHGETGFLDEAPGKAIKVIHLLLRHLPTHHAYQVIFLMRDLAEVVASQRAMLERQGKPNVPLSDKQFIEIFERQRTQTLQWLNSQPNTRTLAINHADIIAQPKFYMQAVNTFLGGRLETSAMAGVVEPSLRHHKAGTTRAEADADR